MGTRFMRYAFHLVLVVAVGLMSVSGCSDPRRQPAPPAEVAELIPKLKDEDPMIRSLVCASLALVGEGDTDAIEALEQMLDDPDEGVRKVAENSLQKLRDGD
jgi:HEAT repeat protein